MQPQLAMHLTQNMCLQDWSGVVNWTRSQKLHHLPEPSDSIVLCIDIRSCMSGKTVFKTSLYMLSFDLHINLPKQSVIRPPEHMPAQPDYCLCTTRLHHFCLCTLLNPV